MYTNENKGYLLFPNATPWQPRAWFDAIDPYLAGVVKQGRTGVAASRIYAPFKQCPVWEDFYDERAENAGQGVYKEAARTYKMNAHLRVPKWFSNLFDPGTSTDPADKVATQVKLARLRSTSSWVYIGDGSSLDQTGEVANSPTSAQGQSSAFDMEVNEKPANKGTAFPALRHNDGANILFVDGHVSLEKHTTVDKAMAAPVPASKTAKSWESEWVTAAGVPTDPYKTTGPADVSTLKRNPNMQLIWSDPPYIYK
jgi:prepilin-type processing-associated H-X9-DG protein